MRTQQKPRILSFDSLEARELLSTLSAPHVLGDTEDWPKPSGGPSSSSVATPDQPLQKLFAQYGGQYASPEYRTAVEAAGFEAQLLDSGIVPQRLGQQFALDRPEHGDLPRLFEESLRERQGLSTTGEGRKAYSYWDAARGAQVGAPAGTYFELFSGGGVKIVSGLIPRVGTGPTSGPGSREAAEIVAAPSSLFVQPQTAQQVGVALRQEQLAYTSAPGKTIQSVGPVYFDPARGIDVHVRQDHTFLKYSDRTVEERPLGSQTPGEVKGKEGFGPSAEVLGIGPGTEIKDGSGNVIRVPQKRVATSGQVFMQEPNTRAILLRPAAEASKARPSISPSTTVQRDDVPGAVGRITGTSGVVPTTPVRLTRNAGTRHSSVPGAWAVQTAEQRTISPAYQPKPSRRPEDFILQERVDLVLATGVGVPHPERPIRSSVSWRSVGRWALKYGTGQVMDQAAGRIATRHHENQGYRCPTPPPWYRAISWVPNPIPMDLLWAMVTCSPVVR